MTLLEEILDFTKKQSQWKQDAVRRLFEKPGGLSDSDYKELYAMLKAEHGIHVDIQINPIPLAKKHLPTITGPDETVVIKAMKNLQHVNRIASDQILEFAPTGVTVIYGGNGSGKSGYTRVLKNACRARDQDERVLPDATNSSEKDTIPEATFDIEIKGQCQSVQWLANVASPDELSSIAVFDSRCARVYLTKEQEVEYLPYGLDILESLASNVFPNIESRLRQDLGKIDTSTDQYCLLRGSHAVGTLIEKINYQTDPEEVKALANLSDADLKRLAELKNVLEEPDPSSTVKSIQGFIGRLKELLDHIDTSMELISNNKVDELRGIAAKVEQASINCQKSADALQSGEDLLPGTGEPVWKILFEAAREFSTKHAYQDMPFPNTGSEARCVLCQQPLGSASKRMEKFEQFIKDDVAQKAESAKRELEQAIRAIKIADLSLVIGKSLETELGEGDSCIVESMRNLECCLEKRKQNIITATDDSSWSKISDIDSNPRLELRNFIAKQLYAIRRYKRAASESQREAIQKEHDDLVARQELANCLPSFLNLLDNIKEEYRLNSCLTDLKTNSITYRQKNLAEKFVTDKLQEDLEKECKLLGFSIINAKYAPRTSKAKTSHTIKMDLATSCSTVDILSEGEQRAIALGAFFAELKQSGHTGAIIMDDPVSSLDHWRRGKVANRLALEAENRQVIVFMHDYIFLDEIRNACGLLGRTPKLYSIEYVNNKSGVVQKTLPNDIRGYACRLAHLEKQLKPIELKWSDCPSSDLIGQMRHLYDEFRAIVELVVERHVLSGVVRRFDSYIRVSLLENVVGFEHDEYSKIYDLFHKCGGEISGHSKPEMTPTTPPSPADLRVDITALRDVIEAIIERRKKQRKRRKAEQKLTDRNQEKH